MADRDATGGGPATVDIGIPTFRRPERLQRLLASLEPSLRAEPGARIVVADNGCDEDTRAVVEAFGARWPGTRYLAVARRGISTNRNALIADFLADERRADWLAMLDDDIAVGADWLTRMLAVGRREQAAVVGAPYGSTAPVESFVVRNSIFMNRPRRPTGPCPPFHSSGNLLLSRALLTAEPALRFDDMFGLSGGEDYDFFSRAADRGARFAWCDEAFGDELLDAARLNARAVAYRYFSTGNYMAVADARRIGRGATAAGQLRLLATSTARALIGIATIDRAGALTGGLRMLIATGGLASLFGYRLYRYR